MKRTNKRSFLSGFSLRRLLLERNAGIRPKTQNVVSFFDIEKGPLDDSYKNKTDNENTAESTLTASTSISETLKECQICFEIHKNNKFFTLKCNHSACKDCLTTYLRIEITESRTNLKCPFCDVQIYQDDLHSVLKFHPELITKYEEFMIRKVLLSEEPSARFCPLCNYAVIAEDSSKCPRLYCQRIGCGAEFCFTCKSPWHEDAKCADDQSPENFRDVKSCPCCNSLISKLDDGSCNHMICFVCKTEFCWLCCKEITGLHYLSPSGCTFWGKKQWSRRKKFFWQLAILIGAPLVITFVTVLLAPAFLIGTPISIGRDLYKKYKNQSRQKRILAVVFGVLGGILISPIVTVLILIASILIMLFYVYVVIPLSLVSNMSCLNRDSDSDENQSKKSKVTRHLSAEDINVSVINDSPTNSGFSTIKTSQSFIELKQQSSTLMEEVDRLISNDIQNQNVPISS